MSRSFSLWFKWTIPCLSRDEWMFHSHRWSPSLIFVNPQNSLQKVDETFNGPYLTLNNCLTLNSSLRLRSLSNLVLLFLTEENILHIIQGIQIDIPLGKIKPNPCSDLELFKSFESEISGLRIIYEELVSLFRFHNQMLGDRSKDFDYSAKHVILRIAWENWNSQKELRANAPHRPHINGCIVGQS